MTSTEQDKPAPTERERHRAAAARAETVIDQLLGEESKAGWLLGQDDYTDRDDYHVMVRIVALEGGSRYAKHVDMVDASGFWATTAIADVGGTFIEARRCFYPWAHVARIEQVV